MWRHTWRERIPLKQRLRALMRWEPRQCKGTFAFLWSKISSRDLILSFSQIHQKYKFMEGSLASRRRKLKSQVYTCILGVFKTWSLVSSYTDLLSGPWHQEQPSNDHQVEGKERGEYLVMTSGNCSSNYFYIILFFLQAEETMETQFLLSEQVYARAKVFSDDGNLSNHNDLYLYWSFHLKVPPTDKVCLWLGANVMLEYTLDDAEVLLKKNCEQVSSSCWYC